MNTLTLAQRVLEAVGADESRLPIPRIVSRIPDALVSLAVAVSVDESRERRELLRKTFTATLTNDVAPLASKLTGDDYLLLASVKSADIFADGFTLPLQYVPDRSSLALSRSPVFGYFALEGTNIYTTNVEDGTLMFKASYVPTLATLTAQAPQLLPELVGVLTAMFSTAQAVAG